MIASQSNRTPVDADGRFGCAEEHPSLSDPNYLLRRRSLGALADGHRVGAPSPFVEYRDVEHEIWRFVLQALTKAQRRYACREVIDAAEAIAIPCDHVPQHDEVNARLRPLTGFGFTLAGGIVEQRRLYGSMAQSYFHSVQYLRHPAVPLYTPEPDAIHDLIGHGVQLAVPRFAELCRLIGQAMQRVSTQETVQLISRIFWFTLEYGVVREHGEFKAYGAALLSSYGELGHFAASDIRVLNVAAMAHTGYRISQYQPILYGADSLDQLTDVLGTFFSELDDETCHRLRRTNPPNSCTG